MTRTAISIALAVLLLVGGWFGYEKYREHQRTKHDEAIGKVEVFSGEVALLKDSLRAKDSTLAAKDSALKLANRPRPDGPTRIVYVRSADTSSRDSTAFVPKSDYDLLGLRYDSLAIAVTAYREAVGPALEQARRVIAGQDSVIKYQRVALDTPKPSRRWGLGLHAGYGGTLHNGLLVQGPQVGVSVQFRFF